jgi:oxygen-independent coproporphyrinogen-3 oxidase
VEEEVLSPRDRGREALLMGLRLAEGIDPMRIETRSGLAFVETIDPAMLAACLDEGYLEWQGPRLVATPEGRVRLDALLPALLR